MRRSTRQWATQAAAGWQALPAGFNLHWDELSNPAARLAPTVYATSTAYDALNRATLLTLPQEASGSRPVLVPTYNRAGALTQVALDGQVLVERLAYNARGQRLLLARGNGLLTRYAYDDVSFRLTRLRTQGYMSSGETLTGQSGSVRQDMAYAYDLAGNITATTERTSQSGVGGTAELERLFDYDALYRLLSATGRENQPTAATPWQDEVRTEVDATKPDAALGYFTVGKQSDICRAVIEIKDAATDLDAKQKRLVPKSAVDQGFEYAPKMRGECRWVIVSNFKEIRFYRANDRSKYQCFLLEELREEHKLQELLFLFHKDRFITRKGDSKTEKLLLQNPLKQLAADKERHVVDEMHDCLNQFEGLTFVDPNYLASLYPFNILDQHVWHFHRTTLFTINPNICRLLEELTVEEHQLVLSEALAKELEEAGVSDYQLKLEGIFKRLNHCHICHFRAVRNYQAIADRNKRTIGFSYYHSFQFNGQEGVEKNINLIGSTSCGCLICLYRDLNLTAFLGKLKAAAGRDDANTMEYAYGNYLAATNNFKTSHDIYAAIEKQAKNRQEKGITYFLAKVNRLHLHNLLRSSYYHEGHEELLATIREIDPIAVLNDELEGEIPAEVRTYLLEINDNKLVHRVEDELRETTEKLTERKKLLKRGGTFNGPHYMGLLWHEYALLYRHLNLNFIIYDSFTKYRSLAKQLFEAAIISYTTEGAGIDKVDQLFLSEAVFHIGPSDLANALQKTRKLATTKGARQKLLAQVSNLLQSFFKNGLFNDPYPTPLLREFLLNHLFEKNNTNVFSNLFILLARMTIKEDEFTAVPPALIGFLTVETSLAPHDIKHLALFIERKGKLFSQKNLQELLEIALLENRVKGNRYHYLIEPLIGAIEQQHPDYLVTDKLLVRKAIANCYNQSGIRAGFKHLAHLHGIANDVCKAVLRTTFEEHLDESFDEDLYAMLLWTKVLVYTDKNYFEQLVLEITKRKGHGFTGMRNGLPHYDDFYFHNFALLVYGMDIDFGLKKLTLLDKLSDFERWLIQPETFDYTTFSTDWLLAISGKRFFNRLAHIAPLQEVVKEKLDAEFSPTLYALYHKHFQLQVSKSDM